MKQDAPEPNFWDLNEYIVLFIHIWFVLWNYQIWAAKLIHSQRNIAAQSPTCCKNIKAEYKYEYVPAKVLRGKADKDPGRTPLSQSLCGLTCLTLQTLTFCSDPFGINACVCVLQCERWSWGKGANANRRLQTSSSLSFDCSRSRPVKGPVTFRSDVKRFLPGNRAESR